MINMDLKIGDIIQLTDSKKYIILGNTNYNNNQFLYLSNCNDITNFEFAIIINESGKKRVEFIDSKAIENKELIFDLLNLFTKDITNRLNSIKEE